MAEPTRAEVLAEAYRRGILPADQRTAYEEAMRRGIVPRAQPDVDISVGAGPSGSTRVSGGVRVTTPESRRPSREQDAAEFAARNRHAAVGVGRATAGGVVQGAVANVNMLSPIRDAIGNVVGETGAGIVRTFGGSEQDQENMRQFPRAWAAADRRTMGATAFPGGNVASYQPQNQVEYDAQRVGQFASGALSPGGPLVRTAAVLAPAAGSLVGEDIDRNMGGTGATGAFVGGMAGSLFRPPGPRPVAPPGTPPPRFPRLAATVNRFDQAGVDPSLATSGGHAAPLMARVAGDNPIAGVPVRMARTNQLGQAETAAGNIANQYGTPRTNQVTGETVQGGIERFANARPPDVAAPASAATPTRNTSFAARADQLYDQAFGPIDAAEARLVERQQSVTASRAARGVTDAAPPVIVRPTETQAVLTGLRSRANAPSLSAIISDPRFGRIADALASDAPEVRFGDLRNLRTWVRLAQRDPELRQGVSQADLQSLEGALTQDIYANARRIGGAQATRDLQRADQFYHAGQSRIQTALQPFTDARSGESAYARILSAAGSTSRADTQQLLSLKRSLRPQEWNDIAANVINELGHPNPGQGGTFSVSQFATNYARLSPRARQILFGSVGGGGSRATSLAAELDNLASVAADLRSAERAANSSGTFSHAQTFGTLTGAVVRPVETAVTVGTMAVTGAMLSSPRVVRWLAGIPAAQRNPAAWSAHMQRLAALARNYPELQQLQQQLSQQPPPSEGTP